MLSIFDQEDFPLSEKLSRLNWLLVLLIIILALVGFLMLYSAAGGSFRPWLIRQLTFFIIFFVVMLVIAVTNIQIWFRFSYLFYAFALGLVIAVDIIGHSAMGATRWFNLGFVKLQPSEIMKVTTVLALARYFYSIEAEDIGQIKYVLIPLAIIAVPALFIFNQPDLGSAIILLMIGILVLFIAGVRMWKFVLAGLTVLAAAPPLWFFVLYDYQKDRMINFLNPNNDPLGTGYNIIQSKIAIGSGGLTGKGFLHGTQGQLNFLPEKQTDFIFTMLAEELGFIGSAFTIALFFAIVSLGLNMTNQIKHQYGKVLTVGILGLFFIHMFINVGMVTGLLPVVGSPLPLISYGGTVTAAMLIGFGLVLNADVYRDASLESSGKPS